MPRFRNLAMAIVVAASPSGALAACPIELAVYTAREGLAGINFEPKGDAIAVTNTFRMWVGDGIMLDGLVMWSEDEARPNAMLMHNCPEGDVTGAEIEACTLWQGVIYTADAAGKIDLLPEQGGEAPAQLIFPDLGPSLRHSPIFATKGFSKAPWDVFALEGCQE